MERWFLRRRMFGVGLNKRVLIESMWAAVVSFWSRAVALVKCFFLQLRFCLDPWLSNQTELGCTSESRAGQDTEIAIAGLRFGGRSVK